MWQALRVKQESKIQTKFAIKPMEANFEKQNLHISF